MGRTPKLKVTIPNIADSKILDSLDLE